MPSTGWTLPTANTVQAGSGTWTSDANILADDGTEATFSLTSKNTDGRWNAGQTFNFDTAIPADAVITQVQIRADWRVNSTGGIGVLGLQAWVSGAGVGSVNENSAEPTTLTTDTYDVTSARSWTRADLLNGTFELRCRGRNGNSTTDPSYRFDHIAANITYEVPAPIVTPLGPVGMTAGWPDTGWDRSKA